MNENQIIELLEKLNISNIEAQIYLMLYKFGPITISELSRKTKIARTTVNENSLRLTEKGLVTKSIKNNRSLLVAESPSKLRLIVMQKRIQLQDEIDRIKDIDSSLDLLTKSIMQIAPKSDETTKIFVKYYEGKNGAKSIYSEAFSAKELRSYVNLGEVYKCFPDNQKLFIDMQLKNTSLIIKEIIDVSEQSVKLAQMFATDKNFTFKTTDKFINSKSIDILIYDNHVAMINFEDNIIGSVLINKDYYEACKVQFDLIWNIL